MKKDFEKAKEFNGLVNKLELYIRDSVTSHRLFNKFTEEFARKILHIAYSTESLESIKLNLKNLNEEKSNYPTIDLGDKASKIAYQVTTEDSISKISETLKDFVDHPDYKNNTYTNLRFFIFSNLNTGDLLKKAKEKYKKYNLDFNEDQIFHLGLLKDKYNESYSSNLFNLLNEQFSDTVLDNKNQQNIELYSQYEGIINEDSIVEIVSGLYSGCPYNCVDLTNQKINPYIELASKVKGQYLNENLQQLHVSFIYELLNLKQFLLKNYSTSSEFLCSLYIPTTHLDGFNQLLVRDDLIYDLNNILDKLSQSYRIYRSEVRSILSI